MQTLPDIQRLRRFQTPAALRAGSNAQSLDAMLRLLPADQRRLAQMVILNRVSHRAAAASFHVTAGVVTRRVQAIRNRLGCPLRRALAVHLDTLPEPARSLAVEHFFGGSSRAALARTFHLSDREIQAQLDYVRGWLRALHRRQRQRHAETLEEPHSNAPEAN